MDKNRNPTPIPTFTRIEEHDNDGNLVGPLGLLRDGNDGTRQLIPAIVMDFDDNVYLGHDVLEAVVLSGVTIQHPVRRISGPGELAHVEQLLAHAAEQLGAESHVY